MAQTRIKIFLFAFWGTVVGLAIYIYISRESSITAMVETLQSFIRQMCNIKQRHFALATVIGTIPGLLTFVFLGGSFSDFRYLFLAAVFLASGLTLSFWLKKSLFIENLIEKEQNQ